MVLLASAAFGCRDSGGKTLIVTITAANGLPPITRVDVTVTAGGHMSEVSVPESAGSVWPVTVAVNVAGLPATDGLVEATAFDSSQAIIAGGSAPVSLRVAQQVDVTLLCQSLVCTQTGADASMPSRDAAADGVDARVTGDAGTEGPDTPIQLCGNGRVDPGETCDVDIASDLPGACPISCDDQIPCTRDERAGDDCQVVCNHTEITAIVAGDGCCPANSDHTSDPDCPSTNCKDGIVEPGETCDTGIASGPGSCPTVASCDDRDPCTNDLLISAGTCVARCLHIAIVAASDGDGCCPIGADARSDLDCPAACGNGIVEPGETCDVAIAAGPGSCPTLAGCADADSCTDDVLTGQSCQAICQHLPITTPIPGDGCCPADGPGNNIDSDCPAICGNGVVEEGETCDSAIAATTPGGCPSTCPAPPATCSQYVMQGSASTCSAACVLTAVTACSAIADGCCPSGCTHAVDPDCSATCNNGILDAGETCDTAIASGPGSCPTSCADGMPCTDDLLIDGETCNARCLFVPTTAFRSGDGCCPPGAHAAVDADCPATCGNGVVETPWETCDVQSVPPSCPTSCPPPETCATWTLVSSSEGCDATCVRQPITACINGDGCCGAGCNSATDSDCAPICGNGIVEPSETCDRGITAGMPGSCPASCTDSDPCTLDFARGTTDGCTRACTHVRVTACAGGDRCCPAGCTAENDGDCAPARCGDSQIQAGETCDPPSTCPTNCADDGDSCTVDQLVGSANTCNAACVHVPIQRCSGTQRDGCCPTGCSPTTDSDC